MPEDVQELAVNLSAKVKDLEEGMAKAVRVFYQAADKMEKRAASMKFKAPKFDMTATLGSLVGAGVSFEVIGKVKQLSEAWTETGNKLQAFGVKSEDTQATLNDIANIADRSRSSFSGTADLYTKLTQSADDLGLSQKEIGRITETVAKSFAISGAGAQQSSAGILQLSQALGSGVLQGDEFKSLMENAPDLMNRLAKALGVPKGKLKEMATEGELTAQKVVGALKKMGSDVDAAFAKTKPTIGQAFAGLETALLRQVGNSAAVQGAIDKITSAVLFLGQNIGSMGSAATIAGVAMLAAYAGPALLTGIGLVTGAIKVLTLAMVRNPITAILVGLAAGAAACYEFRDAIRPIEGSLLTLGDYAGVLWEIMKTGGTAVAGIFTENIVPAIFKFVEVITGVKQDVDGLYDAFKTALNGILALCGFSVSLLVNIWENFPDGIVDAFKAALNLVVNVIEGAVNIALRAIRALDQALGKLTGRSFGVTEFSVSGFLPKLEYSKAGKIAAEAFKKDYLTDFLKTHKEAAQNAKDLNSENARETARAKSFSEKDRKPPKAAATPPKTGGGGGKGGGGGGGEDESAPQKTIEALEKELRTSEALKNAVGLLNHEKRAALEIAKLGIDTNSDEAEKIRELTQAIELNNAAVKKAEEAKTKMKEFTDSFSQGLADVIVDGKNAGDMIKNLANTIAKDLIKSLISGQGLFAGLLSGGGGGGGGFLSGIGKLFGFANGGIMTSGGSMPLHSYSKGGIANSPQLALFGEGRYNEAYVPLPDGRNIPVVMSMPKFNFDGLKAQSSNINLTTRIVVDGARGNQEIMQMVAQGIHAATPSIVGQSLGQVRRNFSGMSSDVMARGN